MCIRDRGIPASYEEVLENVKKRDYIDSTREESPLRQADDALVLEMCIRDRNNAEF